MKCTYAHTNIVARDWRKLASFYQSVFGCQPVPPQRSLSGSWLEKGTGVEGANLEGIHLRLPGYGEEGPTLEIFSYTRMEEKPSPAANRLGLGHLAFAVEEVSAYLERVVLNGGQALGQIVEADIPGKGRLTFTYAVDPEGNIIELQQFI